MRRAPRRTAHRGHPRREPGSGARPAPRRRHRRRGRGPLIGLVTDVYASIASVEAELFAALDANEIDVLHKMLNRIKATAGDDTCDAANDAP
jgi:hypothetical protein